MCGRLIALLLLLATTLSAAEVGKESIPSQRYVIGISPGLPKSVKDEVYRGVVRLLVEGFPLNSTVEMYDALELKTITRVQLPNAAVFQSPKTRANQFGSAIRDLKFFLARENAGLTNGNAGSTDLIRLPQFLDFLAEHGAPSGSQIHLLLIGSPLYQDAKERGFSMVDGYFPSDGHLRASREASVFGFTGDTNELAPITVHWLFFGDPWISDLHREKVTRFWTLYLERRGARMASFGTDVATVLQGFRDRTPGLTSASKHWQADPAQTKIEMLRISRSVEIADWLTRDKLSELSPAPPSTLVGPMKIGIRWKNDIDIDLYATPVSGGETLFFQHTRSPEGYYYKDHRSSPGKEYEFVEFENPVNAKEVEAFINFYKGDCPGGPHGEVRIEFDGKIYSAPFSIQAGEGNRGRTGASQSEYWTRVPIQEMLKLGQAGNRAG